MRPRFFFVLVACWVLLPWGFAIDVPKPKPKPEPFVPLKKKEKSKTPGSGQERKPTRVTPDAEKDEESPPLEPDKDPKEIVSRIAKNMRSSETRLAKIDAGEGTRQIQQDILKDLDSLIRRQQQQEQQQQQQSQQQQSQPEQQQEQQDQQQRQAAQTQSQRQQQKSQKQQPLPREQQGQPKPQPKPEEAKGKQAGGGPKQTAKGEINKLADVYKDIWGHLPETLRKEMDAYGREEFMAKYGDLLKQYYATIAEKARKKGE